MAKRSSSLFSPTRHHALRRGSGSSAMSPSSAPWSRKENALLVQAWCDVAEHPCAALESVDAFQTRLFLRFQEVSGVGNGSTNDDDDTVSMAGSECSMESMDGSDGGAYFARAVRTQTSVVLKTYALRRMAGFIADFVAKQEHKRIQLLEKEKMQTTDGEEVEMREAESEEQSQEAEEDSKPVNWFALSKNDQIERFQKAGASNYIELDEHMYTTIQTILELQDKCKQEAPAANGVNNNVSVGSASTPQNPWSEEEVRHVLDAWRDSHLRTPTKLPGGDSFYARFIARNGENSQRSKPEVADTKIALMNMQRVISAFHNRAPTNGKITRGNLKRQRHNWFTLSLTEKEQAFAEGGSNQGCRFVDISEDMYETVSDLMGSSSVPMSSSFSSSSSSSSSPSGGGGDVTPEPSKRRSIQTKVGTSNTSSDMTSHSIQAETIDLISDDDSSIEDEDGEEKTASVEAVPAPSYGNSDAAEDEGDVDMEENEKGGISADAAVATFSAKISTPAGLVNTDAESGDDLNPGGDADEDRDADPDVAADADARGLDASMESGEELKKTAQTHKTTENDVESRTEIENCCKDAASSKSLGDDGIVSSLEAASIDSINKELEAIDRVASFELELTSPHKKQKLEDPEVAAMLRGIEKQAQHLKNLVRQVQSERDQEREEREKLLKAIKVDQHGREAVLELLRIEQDERRRDRDERHKVLQILLQEQQKRGKKQQCDNTKFKIKDEDAH